MSSTADIPARDISNQNSAVSSCALNNVSSTKLNETFDFASVLQASQSLSSTIQLDELLHKLTQIILQHSGADRCALILPDEIDDWQVRAIATPEETQLSKEPLENNPNLPLKLINYVKSCQQVVVVDDLTTDLPVIGDYLRQRKPKSVLCLPILNQGHLLGLLYLKNRLTSGAFTQERIVILNFLCTQAAISLENARLYALEQQKNQELAKLNQQLSLTEFSVERASEGILWFTQDQKIVNANQAACQMLEYSREELTHLSIDDLNARLFAGNDIPSWQVLKEQRSVLVDTYYKSKNGRIIPVEVSSNFLEFSGQEYCISIIRDISVQKAFEQELQLSESLAKAAFDQAAVGIVESDTVTGQFTRINNRFCEMSGYSQAELREMSVTDFTHPDDIAESRKSALRLMRGEIDSFTVEKRYVRKDGNIFWSATTVSLIHLPGDEGLRLLAIIKDISDRKMAESALKLSEARAKAAFEQAAVGIVESDMATGQLTKANSHFCEMIGYTQSELLELSVKDLTHPQDISDSVENIGRLYAGEIDSFTIEKRYIRKNGSTFWSATTVSLVDVPGEKARTSLGIVKDITDRKQAESALMFSEARAKAAFDQAAVGIGEIDMQTGQLTRANNYFCEITGYSQSELLKLSVQDITHPEDFLASRKHIKRLYNGEISSFTMEKRYLRQDGSLFWAATTVSLIDVPGEKSQRCLKIIKDINDRKHAEQRLKFTQFALDNFADQVLIFRMDSKIIDANPAACQALGYKHQELCHLSLHDICPQKEEDWDTFKRSIKSNRKAYLETFHKKKDGELFPVEISANILEFEGEEYIVGIHRDITDRKATQKSLSLTKFAIDNTAMGIFWINRKGRFFDFNESACYNLGYLPDELRQLYVWDITPGFTADLWDSHWRDVKQEVYQRFEAEHKTKGGKVYPVEITSNYLEYEGEGYLFAQAQVISERKAYEERLEQTNAELVRATRMKDEFLATMSHELRTPLNAILGMTECLTEEIFGSVTDEQVQSLKTIDRSGNHLLGLINDILDLSKIAAGKVELAKTPSDITRLCYSSLQLVQQQAQNNKIQIQTSIPSHLPSQIVDEQRLRQVLLNLLSNAVKFTPEGGQVTLHVHPNPVLDPTGLWEDGYLRIAVIDTGIGIAPDNIDQLFKPFVQIDSALNRQYSGTGLGLALVKQIVELHGGRVMVSSEVDVGSTFTVELPWNAQAPSGSEDGCPTIDVPVEKEDTSAPLILLAEDDAANVLTIESYLTAKGYRLAFAENGKEAVELVQTLKPSLVLMDIQMPVMDGLEAIEKIRTELKMTELPIVALTALAMKGDRERCMEVGATEYLSKPVKLKQLDQLLQQHLAKGR